MELDDDLQELDIHNDVQNQRRRQHNAQQREHDANNRRRRERRSQENVNSFLKLFAIE